MILAGRRAGAWENTEHVTDVRPLVVLDLDEFPILRNPSGMEHWSADVRIERPGMAAFFTKLGETIKAQTKPPRIPEPGLWGVVEAHTVGNADRRQFGRIPESDDQHWIESDAMGWFLWDDLVDPALVRDGIEDGAR
jgi:hypothetical protein